jgi:O-antigen/teichoic acid export membrane protein
MVFSVAASVPQTLLVACGRPNLIALFLLCELLPYLVCSIVLTHKYGAAGAALAWSLRVTIDSVLLFLAARRLFEVRISSALKNAAGCGAAIVALFVPLVMTRGTHLSLPALAGVTLLSVVAYGSVIWTLVLTPAERIWAGTLMDDRRRRSRGNV